jgi:hypothetical protein
MTDHEIFIVVSSRVGRPLRAEAESRPLVVRVSPAERRIIETAAKMNRQNQSQFARDALLTAAEDCLEDVGPQRRGKA